jgi:hypothetical protein
LSNFIYAHPAADSNTPKIFLIVRLREVVVNGWTITSAGLYGTDYLFRAGVTKLGLGANIGQEAIYPPAFTDIEGKTT